MLKFGGTLCISRKNNHMPSKPTLLSKVREFIILYMYMYEHGHIKFVERCTRNLELRAFY